MAVKEKGTLVLELLLQMLVGGLELLVFQEQLVEHLGPGIGAILKKGKVLVLL